MGVLLSGCTSTGLQVTDQTPAVTLPPAEISYVAPIGDASLEYTAETVLYLPSRDGIGLTRTTAQVSYSPVRPDAETLVRALLANPGNKEAFPLGGETKLSLFGTNPVEVSRDTVTVNLSASALQLDRESLFLCCQAITNTLCELPEIRYVNVLVVDKPVGLDIANTLPMGALQKNTALDLGAVYKQLLSRKVSQNDTVSDEPFSANVTLYFPLSNTEGLVSEVRSLSFENQIPADMIIQILRELASGPSDPSIISPPLPLLADLLTATPTVSSSAEAAGNIISLDFAHNLYDMLDAYNISHPQSMASLCYTLSTFFPNVSGITVGVNGSPVDQRMTTEEIDSGASQQPLLRAECSSLLLDYCDLFFGSEDKKTLCLTHRPVPYRQASNPRMLLMELSKGPLPQDSVSDLKSVFSTDCITDTDMLGFSLSEETLLVNFSPTFKEVGEEITPDEERLLAYSIVNTLCNSSRIKNVCFFVSGSQFDGFTGEIYWAGLFYPLPLN